MMALASAVNGHRQRIDRAVPPRDARVAYAMEVRGVKPKGKPGHVMAVSEFERQAGMSPGEASANRLPTRKTPSMDKIKRIAAVLDVPVMWLADNEGPPPVPKSRPAGSERTVELDAVNPLEEVRGLSAYKRAPESVRRAFDQRAPYTPNAAFPDVDAYLRLLLRLKDAVELAPEGAVEDVVSDPDEPTRKRKPRKVG